MKNKLRPIIGWIAAVLIGLSNIVAAVTKFLPMEPGTNAYEMTMRMGFYDMRYQLGIIELLITILFLIPRTSTVGFILMLGYTSGALATNLTHGFAFMEVLPLYITLILLTLSAWGRNPELLGRLFRHVTTANMNTRLKKILGWAPVILVSAFLIIVSALPKLFMSYEGSALQEFSTALGTWDIQIYIGILELACAILILIPRTATIGFVLMTGLLAGAMATGLTHSEVEGVWPWFPFALLLLVTFSAYFRTPELLSRLRNKAV